MVKEIQRSLQMQSSLKVTRSFKSRTLKLFSQAFNRKPTVKAVKKLFPKFDARKNTHWANLIDKSELQLEANETPKPGTRKFNEQFQDEVMELSRELGYRVGKFSWICSPSVSLTVPKYLIQANIGYNVMANKYFASKGRMGHSKRFFSTLEQAIRYGVELMSSQEVQALAV